MDNGSLNLWHCKDNQVYGDTYLFVISSKTIHVPRESDVGHVWLNDMDITDDGGDMNLQAGWNHLEWTSYNQNQDTSFKFNYDFASNVLLMNSEPLPPDIIVEDADVIWNPMINDTPAELNNSINAIEPRIILEYVDSINSTWNPDLIPVEIENESGIFDTGSGTYPSIMGMHNGTIKPNQTITVSTLYTYPCSGTGGHTEFAMIWNETIGDCAVAEWNGYVGDYHNISFNKTLTLEEGVIYNYTLRTGSYPQIHHTDNRSTSAGFITCSEFIDANGKRYNNWVPAIKLFLP